MVVKSVALFEFMPINFRNLFNNPNVPKTGTNPGAGAPTLPGLPDAGNRTFATGIPGFDELSQTASGNVQNLLSGTEDPSITRNLNASFGASSGLAPGSEFLNNRAIDLYGQRGEARKQQGFQDLLAMLGGYSGTVTATPGQVLGDEAGQRDEAFRKQQEADRVNQFNQQMAFDRERQQQLLDMENKRFGLAERQYYDQKPKIPQYYTQNNPYGPGIGGGVLGFPLNPTTSSRLRL